IVEDEHTRPGTRLGSHGRATPYTRSDRTGPVGPGGAVGSSGASRGPPSTERPPGRATARRRPRPDLKDLKDLRTHLQDPQDPKAPKAPVLPPPSSARRSADRS